MKLHGLVLLALIGLSEVAVCQNASPLTDPTFLPPSPRKLDAGNSAASPLVPTAVDPRSATNMEAELKQFRNELREFQTLREEVARNTKAADVATDHLSTHQRQELMDILAKLAKKSIARRNAAPAPVREEPDNLPLSVPQPVSPVFPIESLDSPVSVDIADPFALGKVLFRSGDFIGAEKAFRKTVASPENEMTLKYLIATSLRRQSKWQPAMDAYKAIAESNQDPVLRDLARWQLDNIRWHQQSESQLDQMRQQREKRSEVGTVPSASKAGSRH